MRACVRASFLVFKCAVEFKIASGDLSQIFLAVPFLTVTFLLLSRPLWLLETIPASPFLFSSLSGSDYFQHVSSLNGPDLLSVNSGFVGDMRFYFCK